MNVRNGLVAATFLGLFMGSVYWGLAQQPAGGAVGGQRAVGGFVPGQTRPPVDPAVAARGKTLYGINCQGCHGADLRGGDMGGPNLLRSQVTLSDQSGELIVPIIQGARQAMGMPAIPLNLEDSNTVAAYVRSVIATIGKQGAPPSEQKPLNIVVGNAGDGEAYFNMKCKSCHSPQSDLKGIASRISDAKALQNLWVAGGVHNGSNEGPMAAVAITLPSGEKVEGKLVRIDDFLVTVKLSDGAVRTFRRNGATPKVAVNDPLKIHKDLLPVYTDKDIHNVTAYLVTLK
jgi:cytochrome c oxidase cbb3-type subunit III